jgi:hypothetical protein
MLAGPLMATGSAAAIGVAWLFAGLDARYCARRGAMIADYLRDTAEWVVQIRRATDPTGAREEGSILRP